MFSKCNRCYFQIIIILLSNWSSTKEAARILGIFPVPGMSHYILQSTLMKSLADSGHDVTIVSPFQDNYKPKQNGTYREIVLTGFIEARAEKRRAVNLFKATSDNPLISIYIMNKIGLTLTENTLKHKEMQKLLKSGEKFDVVMVGQFLNDALKGLANYFGGHLILFSSVGTSTWVNHLVGNPSLPSYNPEMLLSLPAHMSYLQRIKNTIFNAVYNVNQHFIFYPKQNNLLKKYVSNDLNLYDALFNVSLVLMNTHESVAFPFSSVPCMKSIGGFHIHPPKKLPADLQEFLDGSKQGVVYFSLGSNVNSQDLPDDKKAQIIEAFSMLKENVLWKYEDLNGISSKLPKNVRIGKWFPQQDLLGHKNVKLFITHAGYASTIETVYYGIPVIAIPIFGDQAMNAIYAESNGFGLYLPWKEITADKLLKMIREVIDTPRYRETAKRKSTQIRDWEIHPLDKALYWINYIIRHNGAPHLRVASLELTWYQYYLLDIYIPLLVCISGILLVIRKFIRIYIRTKTIKEKVI